MILPRSVVKAYGKEQATIMRAAKAELRRIANMLDWSGDVDELILNREAMTSVMADIVSRYGPAAAANAAELFEAMDEAFTGTYKLASMEAETVFDAVNSTVHFAAKSLFPGDGMPPDVEAFLSRLESATVRMVNKQAMDTMAANHRDGIRYKRVTNDEKTCPLCNELESRGYVWVVDELLEVHDGCMCTLVPGFGDDPEISDVDGLYSDIDEYF